MKLLSQGNTNTKILKGTRSQTGFLPFILHLAPTDLSGYNVCGRGVFSNVQHARIRKTKQFFENRGQFMLDLMHDLSAALRSAKRKGLKCVVRLNGTSDIPWERVRVENGLSIIALYPEIQFYDYTKHVSRALQSVRSPNWPKNYHLTFSKSEVTPDHTWRVRDAGVSVAIIFSKTPGPKIWGIPTINGDVHDFRFLDPRGVIVALTAKGKAKRDTSGFVITP